MTDTRRLENGEDVAEQHTFGGPVGVASDERAEMRYDSIVRVYWRRVSAIDNSCDICRHEGERSEPS